MFLFFVPFLINFLFHYNPPVALFSFFVAKSAQASVDYQ